MSFFGLFRLLGCGIAAVHLCGSSMRAATYYWDDNGATPGSSTTPNGTLGTDMFLSTSSTGSTAATVTTPTAADTLNFVALSSTTTDTTSGSASFRVDINGTAAAPQTILGLNVTIAGNASSNTDALTLGPATAPTTGNPSTEELDIGSGGITVQRFTSNTSSGSVVNGYLTVNTNIGLTAAQTWTFNSLATVAGIFNGNIVSGGGATGTNLILSSSTGRVVTINGGVNMNGTLSQTGGTANSFIAINGVIGSNVTGLTVNSGIATNSLTLGSATTAVSNTYTGTTSVQSGSLILNNTAAATGSQTGAGAVNVAGSTSVLAGSNGVSSGLLTVTQGGQITPGSKSGQAFQSVGTLHLGTSGGVVLTDATLNFDLSTTTAAASDKIYLGTGTTATGALSLGALTFNFEAATSATGTTLQTGTAYTLITAASTTGFNPANITTSFLGGLANAYTATYTDDGSNLQVTFTAEVPEPSTLAAGFLMLATFGGAVYKRTRHSRPAITR